MTKRIVRLTEGQLHNIIAESVNQILSELDWKSNMNAARKLRARGENDRADKMQAYANEKLLNKHFGGKNHHFSEISPSNGIGGGANLTAYADEKGGYVQDDRHFGGEYKDGYNTFKATGTTMHGFGKDLTNNEKGYGVNTKGSYFRNPNNSYNKHLDNVPDEYKEKFNSVAHDIDDYYNNKASYQNGKWSR